MQPTIVLVHGAFAESSSWDAVIDRLLDAGHPVIAAPNPLRGIASDAASVADVIRVVDGPVVLVAHSYGGAVISNVPADGFHDLFCPDVSDQQAARMAATQRPGTQEGLVEPSGEGSLWRDLPSWFLIGAEDHIIPAALQRYMARRAGARRVIEIPGASHAALVSRPDATAQLILEVAASPVAA